MHAEKKRDENKHDCLGSFGLLSGSICESFSVLRQTLKPAIDVQACFVAADCVGNVCRYKVSRLLGGRARREPTRHCYAKASWSRMMSFRDITLAVVFVLLTVTVAPPVRCEVMTWFRDLDANSRAESATGVAADGIGNSYIAGYVEASLSGPHFGASDAYLIKYDADGNYLWGRQVGTERFEAAYAVAANSTGAVFVGITSGDLFATNLGSNDVVVSKWSADGSPSWDAQFGTQFNDRGLAAAISHDGSTYVAGSTLGNLGSFNAGNFDAFLTKITANGQIVWSTLIGTLADDVARGVAVDGTEGIYVAGATRGNLNGANYGQDDAFLVRIDATTGSVEWSRQLGTSSRDYCWGVSTDGDGNAYIAGVTAGDLDGTNQGEDDAFLAKYDSLGNLEWIRQLGSDSSDDANAVSVDELGGVYIAGSTRGKLGETNDQTISEEAFVAKFDENANHLWTQQFVGPITFVTTDAKGVAADNLGNVYAAGQEGHEGQFLARFNDNRGDFSRDGLIRGDDFLEWQQGAESFYAMADLDVWLTNFGINSATLSGQIVSEPKATALAALWLSAVSCLHSVARRFAIFEAHLRLSPAPHIVARVSTGPISTRRGAQSTAI